MINKNIDVYENIRLFNMFSEEVELTKLEVLTSIYSDGRIGYTAPDSEFDTNLFSVCAHLLFIYNPKTIFDLLVILSKTDKGYMYKHRKCTELSKLINVFNILNTTELDEPLKSIDSFDIIVLKTVLNNIETQEQRIEEYEYLTREYEYLNTYAGPLVTVKDNDQDVLSSSQLSCGENKMTSYLTKLWRESGSDYPVYNGDGSNGTPSYINTAGTYTYDLLHKIHLDMVQRGIKTSMVKIKKLKSLIKIYDIKIETVNDLYAYCIIIKTRLLNKRATEFTIDNSKKYIKPLKPSIYDKSRDTGYYGHISSDEFIGYGELSDTLGFTKGELMPDDMGWLKFWYKGSVCYIPQHPIRHSVSWDDINNLDLVYGKKNVNINGNIYSVELMSGGRANPLEDVMCPDTSVKQELELDLGYGSMWNELIYRVHRLKPGVDDVDELGTGGPQHGDNWDNLNDVDLNIYKNKCPKGALTLTRESSSSYSNTKRVGRGYHRLAYLHRPTAAFASDAYGWRPVLTLI